MSRIQMRNQGRNDYAVDFGGWGGLHGCSPDGGTNFMSENTTLDATTGAPLGEISQTPPALEVFLDKHQMKLIVLAVLLILVAIVFVIMRGVKQSNEETAGAMLVSAEDISGLQAVVKNHGDTSAAFSAKILLAEKQWEDGQQDDSIATLRAFIGAERDHPAWPSAQSSLAAKLLSQGKTDEAEGLFKELTDAPEARYLAPYAWIRLGDIAMESGKTEAAEKAYETVEEDFPGSSYAQEALQRRLLLKAEAPLEVTAPIVVPEVNFTDDEDGSQTAEPPSGEAGVEEMLESLQNGTNTAPPNPLLPEENSTPPSE